MFFSESLFGLRSIYCPSSVSCSFFVPNFGISEFLTCISCRLGSFLTLVVGLIFPTVLPGARTSYKLSKFFFWRCFVWIFCAIFTCTLCSLPGNDQLTPLDHMSRGSPSLIFSCSLLALAFEAQINFSISVSEHEALCAHCSSVR